MIQAAIDRVFAVLVKHNCLVSVASSYLGSVMRGRRFAGLRQPAHGLMFFCRI